MSENSINSKLLRLIIDAGCFSERDGWIDLDHIWQRPVILEKFAVLLSGYLVDCQKNMQFTRIVVANKVYGAFGILPIMAVCSAKTGIPFIIWKEWGKPATGDSIFYGKVQKGDRLLILHDVINYGATPIKEALELRNFTDSESCTIVGILSVLDKGNNGLAFVEERTSISTKAILRWQDLKEYRKGDKPRKE